LSQVEDDEKGEIFERLLRYGYGKILYSAQGICKLVIVSKNLKLG